VRGASEASALGVHAFSVSPPNRLKPGHRTAGRAPLNGRLSICLLSRRAFWAHPIREEARTKKRGCPTAMAYLAYLVRKSDQISGASGQEGADLAVSRDNLKD